MDNLPLLIAKVLMVCGFLLLLEVAEKIVGIIGWHVWDGDSLPSITLRDAGL